MPAKFCAAYSSAALVVNTFAPLKHAPSELRIAGLDGFSRPLIFEGKCPNGLKEDNGRQSVPPNLDVLLEEEDRILAIESKFLEPEPANAAELEPYLRHRAEIRDFAAVLEASMSHIRFKALSYRDLWGEWESHSDWSGMLPHLSRLRSRYELSL